VQKNRRSCVGWQQPFWAILILIQKTHRVACFLPLFENICEVMIMNNTTHGKEPGTLIRYARRLTSPDKDHASSEQMPAGGWLHEISSQENWRTTTIVRRHRDKAASPPSH
jgi:hypothetical protein